MTISDLIIIYFACGAPFAVYFYLQNRERLFSRQLIFKTVLNFLFWIPVSLQYALKKRIGRKANGLRGRLNQNGEVISDANLETIQKQIERLAESSDAPLNFYDLREILNRYVGLTLAVNDEPATNFGSGEQLFEIADVENAEIGVICLQRRNRQRLLFHQTQAAEDFSKAIFLLGKNVKNSELLFNSSVRLTDLLNDAKTGGTISDFYNQNMQNNLRPSVAKVEKSLWNMPPKQSNARQVSLNLSSLNRTKLRLKD